MIVADQHLQDSLSTVCHALFAAGRPSEPTVLRHGATTPLTSPDEVFQVLLAQTTSPSFRSRHQGVRLYRSRTVVTNLQAHTPSPNDGDLTGYLARLQAQTGEHRWGFTLSDPQVASGRLFRALLTFIGEMNRLTSTCHYIVRPDIWCVSNDNGLIPIHKDAQDVVTFVIGGRRRYMLWPFDYFVAHARLGPMSRLKMDTLPAISPEDHRSHAVTIDVEPGDVVFWPAEWWHVGQAFGGLALTLAVGIFRDTNPIKLLFQAAEAMQVAGELDASGAYMCSADSAAAPTLYRGHVERVLSHGPIADELARRLMRCATAGGMSVPVNLEPIAPYRRDDIVTLTSPAALSWRRQPDTGELLCFAAGREITAAFVDEHLGLLTTLKRDRRHRVGDLIGAACHGCVHDRQRHGAAVARAEQLLALLVQCHALERTTGHARDSRG